MSALELPAGAQQAPPPNVKICPKMSHAIAVPMPSQRVAPAGMQAMEMNIQVIEVACLRERCGLWTTGEYNNTEGHCGLLNRKEGAK